MMENIRGWHLLNNPLLFKVFRPIYKQLVVNGISFECLIKPNVYYFKNEGLVSMTFNIHPPGRFQLTMRIKMPKGPFVIELLWKYKVERIK